MCNNKYMSEAAVVKAVKEVEVVVAEGVVVVVVVAAEVMAEEVHLEDNPLLCLQLHK
jgi:hypothetical protein